ncbi:unnamed protein product, partial [Ectocarpus fasciculatus]
MKTIDRRRLRPRRGPAPIPVQPVVPAPVGAAERPGQALRGDGGARLGRRRVFGPGDVGGGRRVLPPHGAAGPQGGKNRERTPLGEGNPWHAGGPGRPHARPRVLAASVGPVGWPLRASQGVVGQDALRGGQVRGGLRALRGGPGCEAASYRGVVLAGRGEDEAGAVAGVPAGLLDGGAAGAGGRGGVGKHGRRPHAPGQLGRGRRGLQPGAQADAEQLADVGEPGGGVDKAGEVELCRLRLPPHVGSIGQ